MNDRALEDIPDINASLEEMCAYALSFNGYHYIGGGPSELADLWDRVIPLLNDDRLDQVSLEDIRACLFWQQRADRYHQDYDIEGYRGLIKAIRDKCGDKDA